MGKAIVCPFSLRTVFQQRSFLITQTSSKFINKIIFLKSGLQSSSDHESDDEDDGQFFDDSSLARDSKVVKFSTTTMRTDVILKSALGVARKYVNNNFILILKLEPMPL